MSLLLAPYTNAMRLGQGFNSYTQQICVDDAVVVDPARPENVITNDGTTMRIVAEISGKPSAWNRLQERISDGPTSSSPDDDNESAVPGATDADASTTPKSDTSAPEAGADGSEQTTPPTNSGVSEPDNAGPPDETTQDSQPGTETSTEEAGAEPEKAGDASIPGAETISDGSLSETESVVVVSSPSDKGATEPHEDAQSTTDPVPSSAAAKTPTETPKLKEPATKTPKPKEPVTKTPEPKESATKTPEPKESATETPEPKEPATKTPEPKETTTAFRTRSSSVVDRQMAPSQPQKKGSTKFQVAEIPTRNKTTGAAVTPPAVAKPSPTEAAKIPVETPKPIDSATQTTKPATAAVRTRSSSVGKKTEVSQPQKKGSSKFQVAEVPTRNKASVAPAKPLTEVEKEYARLDKELQLKRMNMEKDRIEKQLQYRQDIQDADRAEERKRREEDRAEQAVLRKEKRDNDKARRDAAQKAISEAAAAKSQALTMGELDAIRAQNQFVDRFDGVASSKEEFHYDPTTNYGPSQTVTYSSKFIDKLSDVTDDMCISGALSVKMAKIGGSGRGSFVDSDKFKQSDLNFYISVKVVNQTVNFKDALVYNRMRSITEGSDDFNKVYGDSFISGFVEGGEFNAIVSMKIHNKAKLLDIKAEAKVALTAGPVDLTAEANVGIARTNLEMNTETTISVSWHGGGSIKPVEQPWNIDSIMQAAARFPSLVANCPQRTHAILTKYDSLRSFVALRPAAYSPLQYENAQIYTNVLMDAFMSYKALYKRLGDQIQGVQNKTLEIVAWTGNDTGSSTGSEKTTTSSALTLIGKAAASGDSGALALAKKYAAALAAAADISPFDASLQGISNARKFIRRQMVYIVNEVDLIEKDPKTATDEDHEEPFQSPSMFETRLPTLQIPEKLRPKPNAISGRRLYAQTLSEDELKAEQEKQEAQEEQDGTSPQPYSSDQALTSEETASIDKACERVSLLGKYFQVSRAVPVMAPTNQRGKLFNNLDFLYPDWQVESVAVGIDDTGTVCSVEVAYDNGLILRKGMTARLRATKTLNTFQRNERITAVAIETGEPVLATDSKKSPDARVLSVCMWTNHGRRLLGQAAQNEAVEGGKVKKMGSCTYQNVQSLYLDSAFSAGTFKGFFGLLDEEKLDGGILRLGIIWGDATSPAQPPAPQDGALAYDVDPSTIDAQLAVLKKEKEQAVELCEAKARSMAKELDDVHEKQVKSIESKWKERLADDLKDNKQIKFGNGVTTGRQSVSFRGDSFKVAPSDKPFLTFENGNVFKYQKDANFVVYDKGGSYLWARGIFLKGGSVTDCNMEFHGSIDGNLLAYKSDGMVWDTTRDAAQGTLVLSSERPYVEIFNKDGVRRWHSDDCGSSNR